MLGWHISVYRTTSPKSHGTPERPELTKIAQWQAGCSGIDWIDDLVKEGKAVSLGGDGYPYRYKAMAKHLKDTIFKGPPYVRYGWSCDAGDTLTSGWLGRTGVDRAAWEACDPDEWLDIEVWDES